MTDIINLSRDQVYFLSTVIIAMELISLLLGSTLSLFKDQYP